MDQQIKQTEKNTAADPLQILLINTYTKNDAIRRLRLLSELLNYKIFKQEGKLSLEVTLANFKESAGKDSFRTDFESDMDFLKRLPATFYETFLPTQINAQLKMLEDKINTLKVVLVYIPFDIPQAERLKLGHWFKESFGAFSLFDIVFDPQLIGGCALSFNGVYKDYSLRAKIKANKQAVLKELTAYKKQ